MHPITSCRKLPRLAATLLPLACSSDAADEAGLDRAQLSSFVLDESTPLPPSPTNRFADDPRAASLGQIFFFDTAFSPNGTTCASCHDLQRGGADTRAVGPLSSPQLTRNTPTMLNSGFTRGINHWAGIFTALWSVPPDLALGSSVLHLAHHVHDEYREPWEAIFGPLPELSDADRFPPGGGSSDPIWEALAPEDQAALERFLANLGKSSEAFLRTLVTPNAPFDRWVLGDDDAITPAAERGAALFVGKAGCAGCHSGPAFKDGEFHAIGVPQLGDGLPETDFGRAGSVEFMLGWPLNAHNAFSDDPDYGQRLIEGLAVVAPEALDADCEAIDGCGAFLTPTLRNVAQTAPYMHTGGFSTLEEVVDFYDAAPDAGPFRGRRDPRIRPLGLSPGEKQDLVAFLTSLTSAPPAERAMCPPEVPRQRCGDGLGVAIQTEN